MREFAWRDGQIIRWDRFGTGPAVVFCHGTPWSSELWRPIATALSSRYTVHLWDMPGYGRSTQTDGQDVSLAAQGEALADLIRHWGLDEPVVVALRPWGSPFFRLVAENAAVFAALPDHLHEALVREYVAGAAHRPLRTEDHDMLVRPWLGATGKSAFYRQIAQADEQYTDEIEPLYASIDLPVLVVWDADDTWIPVDRSHRLAETISSSELQVVPDAGHLIQLDAPERLTAILADWLATHAS